MKKNTRQALCVSVWFAACLLFSSIMACTGCAYSIIPTASLDRAKAGAVVIVEEGDNAGQRAADYKAQGKPEAAAEADRLHQVGQYAGREIGAPLSDGKPVGEAARPFGQAVLAAAQANPWTATLVGLATVLIPTLATWGTIKHRQASHADKAHAWEERVSADESLGPAGAIDYDSADVKARALEDVTLGRLPMGALRRIYPNGT